MTQEEKHDLVMQVIDAALKKVLGVHIPRLFQFLSVTNHENDTEFFHINGYGRPSKEAIEKALKYVSEYKPKKVVKHKVAILVLEQSELNEIHKVMESKGINYEGLKDLKDNPILFFDEDPNESKKIWLDMSTAEDFSYNEEQGWKFLGTYKQAKNEFFDAVNDQN